jgi:hypothetical protein
LTKASEEKRYERDKRMESLDKRKEMYSKSLTALSYMIVSKEKANPNDLTDLILIGDEKIDNIFREMGKIKELSEWNSKDYQDLTSKLIVIMRDNIKQVEKEIAELQTTKKHWWQF